MKTIAIVLLFALATCYAGADEEGGYADVAHHVGAANDAVDCRSASNALFAGAASRATNAKDAERAVEASIATVAKHTGRAFDAYMSKGAKNAILAMHAVDADHWLKADPSWMPHEDDDKYCPKELGSCVTNGTVHKKLLFTVEGGDDAHCFAACLEEHEERGAAGCSIKAGKCYVYEEGDDVIGGDGTEHGSCWVRSKCVGFSEARFDDIDTGPFMMEEPDKCKKRCGRAPGENGEECKVEMAAMFGDVAAKAMKCKYALYASKAETAVNAEYASEATRAIMADKAIHSDSAENARSANTAVNARMAMFAKKAKYAIIRVDGLGDLDEGPEEDGIGGDPDTWAPTGAPASRRPEIKNIGGNPDTWTPTGAPPNKQDDILSEIMSDPRRWKGAKGAKKGEKGGKEGGKKRGGGRRNGRKPEEGATESPKENRPPRPKKTKTDTWKPTAAPLDKQEDILSEIMSDPGKWKGAKKGGDKKGLEKGGNKLRKVNKKEKAAEKFLDALRKAGFRLRKLKFYQRPIVYNALANLKADKGENVAEHIAALVKELKEMEVAVKKFMARLKELRLEYKAAYEPIITAQIAKMVKEGRTHLDQDIEDIIAKIKIKVSELPKEE